MKNDDEIDALRKRIEELERKAKPPEPKKEFVPMSDEEWRDRMHQLAEKRMSMAMPPSVIRELAVLDDRMVKEIALRDARAPTSAQGMIPDSGSGGGSPRPSAGDGKGYVEPRPLSPPEGTNWVDAIAIADDARQRAELKRKLEGK
jgi:hypothetical protein